MTTLREIEKAVARGNLTYQQGLQAAFREGQKQPDRKAIGHHHWSHDGPCEEGCYYETFE